MGDKRASDERLPWLDPAPRRASSPAAPAAPRKRAPLMLLLAVFLAAGIAVIGFLAGRTTAPRAVPPPVPAPAIVLPAPPATRTPAPVVPRVAVPAEATRAAVASPVASPAPPAKPRTVRRASRPDRRDMIPRVERAFPAVAPASRQGPRAVAPRARRAARPTAGVVQLGAYTTVPQLQASWRRLVRAYPRLATRPRTVTVAPPSPGRPLYYRLRVRTASRREARALCNRLHAIGRGCMVVVNAK